MYWVQGLRSKRQRLQVQLLPISLSSTLSIRKHYIACNLCTIKCGACGIGLVTWLAAPLILATPETSPSSLLIGHQFLVLVSHWPCAVSRGLSLDCYWSALSASRWAEWQRWAEVRMAWAPTDWLLRREALLLQRVRRPRETGSNQRINRRFQGSSPVMKSKSCKHTYSLCIPHICTAGMADGPKICGTPLFLVSFNVNITEQNQKS